MRKVIRKTTFIISLIVAFIAAIILFSICIPKWSTLNKQSELNLPHNNYNIYNFTDDALKSYDDNMYTSCLGIDISSLDSISSFKSIKEQGIEFVYLRVGYRGIVNGEIRKDSKFEEYYKQAKENGFKVGVYFFSQAINSDEAIEEANFILENIKDKEIDLPIAYDFESTEYEDARTDGMTNDILTSNMVAFCNTIEENNYDSIVYVNKDAISTQIYNLEELFKHRIWYAQYHSTPKCKYPFEIWQYSEQALINGIDNECDINIMLIKKEDY